MFRPNFLLKRYGCGARFFLRSCPGIFFTPVLREVGCSAPPLDLVSNSFFSRYLPFSLVDIFGTSKPREQFLRRGLPKGGTQAVHVTVLIPE